MGVCRPAPMRSSARPIRPNPLMPTRMVTMAIPSRWGDAVDPRGAGPSSMRSRVRGRQGPKSPMPSGAATSGGPKAGRLAIAANPARAEPGVTIGPVRPLPQPRRCQGERKREWACPSSTVTKPVGCSANVWPRRYPSSIPWCSLSRVAACPSATRSPWPSTRRSMSSWCASSASPSSPSWPWEPSARIRFASSTTMSSLPAASLRKRSE